MSAQLRPGKPRRSLVVEFVGLPGSGKTTITNLLPDAWYRRRRMPDAYAPLQARLGLYRSAWRLYLSLRPRRAGDIGKFFSLADQLSYYMTDFGRPLVLDQGVIQKIWSGLVWREDFNRDELARLVSSLAPVSADLIVWLRTPVEEAVRRIAARPHGRSRFDRRPVHDVADELAREEANIALLVEMFSRHAKARVLELSGHDAPEDAAARVVAAAESLREPR